MSTTEPMPDPAEIWAQAIELEERARELRRTAVRAALERHHGMVQAAATALGLTRSHLRNLLDGAAYADLKALAEGMRTEAGYRTGRAPAALYPTPTEE